MFHNIEGLLRKQRNLELTQIVKEYDIIGLVETWIPDKTEYKSLNHIVYNNTGEKIHKLGRVSGGISLLISNNSNLHVRKLVSPTKKILWAEINLKNDIIILGIAYNPPQNSKHHDTNIFHTIENEITKFENNYDHPKFIILADFNARLGTKDTAQSTITDNNILTKDYDIPRKSKDKTSNNEGDKLLNFCNNCNLKILNGNFFNDTEGNYTYIHPQGASTIDFALISENVLDLLTDFDIINATTSAHNGLSLTLNYDTHTIQNKPLNLNPIRNPNTHLRWIELHAQSFANNISDSIGMLYLIGINEYTQQNNIQEAVNLLYDCIINSSHNMIKNTNNIQLNNKSNYWFDQDCQEAKSNLNRTLKNYKKNTTELNRNKYMNTKAEYKILLEAKRNKFTTEESNRLNTWLNQKQDNKIWEYIKTLKNRNYHTNLINTETWEIHYKNLIGITPPTTSPILIGPSLSYIEHLDKPIQLSEITKAINSIKTNAIGSDRIPIIFWKKLIQNDKWLNTLKSIFNKIMATHKYPNEWNNAVLISLYKGKGKPQSPLNYRGIAILSSLSKAFTKILASRLATWLENHEILNKFQAGARKNHSTIDNIIILNTLIEKTLLCKRRKLYCGFIDLKNAYDSIIHNILYYKLRKTGISDKFCKLIQIIYENNTFSIKSNDKTPNKWPIKRGLRQGCNLSSILFNIFLNDLFDETENYLNHCPTLDNSEIPALQYADDLCFLTITPIGLTKALKHLQNYCDKWYLTINPTKSKILICSKGSKHTRYERWSIKNEEIEIVNKFTYLGYTFNKLGNANDHISKMKHRGKQALTLIHTIQSKIPDIHHSLVKRIYYSTIEPQVTYAIVALFHIPQAINTINQIRASLCKKLLYLPRNSANTAARYELGIDSAYVSAIVRACKFYWKKLNSRNNSILSRHLISNHPQHQHHFPANLKNELDKLGLSYLWNNFGITPLKLLTIHIKNRARDITRQNDVADLNSKSSLIFYTKLKTNWSTTQLIFLNSKKARIGLSWARMGIFRLKNRRGLYPQNICPLCNGTENLQHIIISCENTSNMRREILSNLIPNAEHEFSHTKLLNSQNQVTLTKTGLFLYKVKILWERKTKLISETPSI